LITLLFFTFFTTSLFAQTTYYSTGNGNFDDTNFWDTSSGGSGNYTAGANESTNTFIIENGDQVTFNITTSVSALQIDSGGEGAFDDNSGSGITVTVVNDFTNNGSVTTASAATSFPQHTIRIGDDFTGTGTFNGFNNDAGTGQTMLSVEFYDNASADAQSFSLSGTTIIFYGITASNTTDALTMTNSDYTVLAGFTINASTDVTLGSGTITLNHNMTISTSTVNFDAGSSTLYIEGSGNKKITISENQSLNNLTLDKSSGTFELEGSTACNRDISFIQCKRTIDSNCTTCNIQKPLNFEIITECCAA